MLELIISDAIRRAKTRVPRKGLSRVDRQRALIVEALTYVGWEPALAHRDAEAFSGGHWEEFVRGFADEWGRGRKPSRGHLLWGAKTYKLTPQQFDLLLGDEPLYYIIGRAHLSGGEAKSMNAINVIFPYKHHGIGCSMIRVLG